MPKKRIKANKKLNNMTTREIRQLFGGIVGNDVTDADLIQWEREDMIEFLKERGYP